MSGAGTTFDWLASVVQSSTGSARPTRPGGPLMDCPGDPHDKGLQRFSPPRRPLPPAPIAAPPPRPAEPLISPLAPPRNSALAPPRRSLLAPPRNSPPPRVIVRVSLVRTEARLIAPRSRNSPRLPRNSSRPVRKSRLLTRMRSSRVKRSRSRQRRPRQPSSDQPTPTEA
jgi:hypothetical protein